jgi:hypothetical protein
MIKKVAHYCQQVARVLLDADRREQQQTQIRRNHPTWTCHLPLFAQLSQHVR